MIQAYIDESGVKGTDPVFVLAGFIAQAEKWAELSSAWNEHARSEPSVQYLKMNDAAKLKGEFRGWKPEERDRKLHGFIDILKRFAHRAIHCTIDLDAYIAQNYEGPMRDPYYMGFNVMVAGSVTTF